MAGMIPIELMKLNVSPGPDKSFLFQQFITEILSKGSYPTPPGLLALKRVLRQLFRSQPDLENIRIQDIESKVGKRTVVCKRSIFILEFNFALSVKELSSCYKLKFSNPFILVS